MELKRIAMAVMGHFLASLLYVLRRVGLVNAVDTTSILEHREELRELWEKRIMADENQSSPSSTATEKIETKQLEEDTEGKIEQSVKQNGIESIEKLGNGYAKVPEHDGPKSEHLRESESVEKDIVQNGEAVLDSLENTSEDAGIHKITTAETTIIAKQIDDITAEAVMKIEGTHEQTKMQLIDIDDVVDNAITTAPDGKDVIEKEEEKTKRDEQPETVSKESHADDDLIIIEDSDESVAVQDSMITTTTTAILEVTKSNEKEVADRPTVPNEKFFKALEIESATNDDDDDGYVRVEECLPPQDDLEDDVELPQELKDAIPCDNSKPQTPNGPSRHELLFLNSAITPEPMDSSPAIQPEMEQFVKSGGLKRILPGVQKTEQPYSSCTTETKIAMEIREMREREEELKLMREKSIMSPTPPKSPSVRSPSPKDVHSPVQTPPPSSLGYKVSSVFRASPDEEKAKLFKLFGGKSEEGKLFANKETTVEKEIRMAKEREEELRNQKGLPPRDDDPFVKPSQVKSSQVRVFGNGIGAGINAKQAATAKIQLEIEEQTQREMALRETGSIQTISQERTDSKVAKLKSPDAPITNGGSHPVSNGFYTNGRSSPDTGTYKRGSPSPTGARPASIFSNGTKGSMNMQKFIATKGKEPSRNGLIKEDAKCAPGMVKLKRTVSVESKIQQEILDMKQREDELKSLHHNGNGVQNEDDINEDDINEADQNNFVDYKNGINEEDLSPRHNKLIAQWEQRIQKAES